MKGDTWNKGCPCTSSRQQWKRLRFLPLASLRALHQSLLFPLWSKDQSALSTTANFDICHSCWCIIQYLSERSLILSRYNWIFLILILIFFFIIYLFFSRNLTCCEFWMNRGLTDLQLPSNSSFTLFSEVHLSLVVFCHHLHKLLSQDGVLFDIKAHSIRHGRNLDCISWYLKFNWNR